MHRGDRIWWDLHDWTATDDRTRLSSARSPSRSCTGSGAPAARRRSSARPTCPTACKQVAAELKAVGVPAASAAARDRVGDGLARGAGRHLARRAWHVIAGSLIDHGPSASGVYARFTARRRLAAAARPARPRGRARSAPARAGRRDRAGSSAPTWLDHRHRRGRRLGGRATR